MNRQEFIDTYVEKRMTLIHVVRVSGCKFPNPEHPCPNDASYASSFDGTPLCPSHIDAYVNHMRAFFLARANESALTAKFDDDVVLDEPMNESKDGQEDGKQENV